RKVNVAILTVLQCTVAQLTQLAA
ncbi:MAG: hypothetical protein QOE82_53, partial [Thermoanaerobaculia bacterium]|nr:hypothetical protein [Thermoanaerobaculia bacterium]